MPVNSVNTNVGAMIALQNLNKTNTDLQTTQNRINTGLKVASAKDNGATWAIAQNQRSAVSSLDAVKDSLSRASSVVDVASSAGESISDMLTQLKEKALAASDTSLDSTSRKALNADFKSIVSQISKTIQNSSFNGINLLDGSKTSITALANDKGTSVMTVAAQNMSLSTTGAGTIITLSLGAELSSATHAGSLLTTLDTSISNVSSALANLGTASKSLENHADFVGKLQDSITAGIGNLVDADLAKESAQLQALQTKQQLGIQALSIANGNAQNILSLFRN